MHIEGTYKTVDTSVDNGNLDLHRQRLVLSLLYRGVSSEDMQPDRE